MDHAISTLRIEFYRIEAQIRAVPIGHYAFGFSPDNDHAKQREVVEALLILGADVTPDMLAKRNA